MTKAHAQTNGCTPAHLVTLEGIQPGHVNYWQIFETKDGHKGQESAGSKYSLYCLMNFSRIFVLGL